MRPAPTDIRRRRHAAPSEHGQHPAYTLTAPPHRALPVEAERRCLAELVPHAKLPRAGVSAALCGSARAHVVLLVTALMPCLRVRVDSAQGCCGRRCYSRSGLEGEVASERALLADLDECRMPIPPQQHVAMSPRSSATNPCHSRMPTERSAHPPQPEQAPRPHPPPRARGPSRRATGVARQDRASRSTQMTASRSGGSISGTRPDDETPRKKPFRAPHEGFCHFVGLSPVSTPWR